MKANKKYISRMLTLALAGSLFGAGLSACSDDVTTPEEPIVTPPVNEDGKYFLTLNVSVPNAAGTRNSTDQNGTSGEEIPGTAKESVLNQATIYFAVNNEVKFSFESDYIEAYPSGTSGKTHQIRIKIDDDINKFARLVGEEDVQMFIVGNKDNLITSTIDNDLSKAKFSISSVDAPVIGDFGNEGHIMPLMNASEFKLGFTTDKLELTVTEETTDEDKVAAVIKKYFTRDTGTILWWDVKDAAGHEVLNLERGVARLEFKDIDRTGTRAEANPNSSLNAYCYKIGSSEVIVKLHALTPFNVNKESYLFRHTAKGNYSKANTAASLFGVENGYAGTDYNWVAGSDWSFSSGVFTKSPNFWNALELQQLSDEDDDWAYVIETSGGSSDGTILIENLKSRNNGSGDGFHPWCYVSENTLPSTELFVHHKEVTSTPEAGEAGGETQESTVTQEPVITANATGVLFTVLVMNKNGDAPLIYDATGKSYPQEIENSEETEGNIIITMGDENKWVELEPVDGKYYMKYIACIVHNQPQTGTSGYAPMQYGVVRNNTYQIQVKEIPFIPLPRDPKSVWISLLVEVKPWTVRYNEIEF